MTDKKKLQDRFWHGLVDVARGQKVEWKVAQLQTNMSFLDVPIPNVAKTRRCSFRLSLDEPSIGVYFKIEERTPRAAQKYNLLKSRFEEELKAIDENIIWQDGTAGDSKQVRWIITTMDPNDDKTWTKQFITLIKMMNVFYAFFKDKASD